MAKESVTGMQPDKAAVRMRAFDLWRRAGMPEGRDIDFWLEAERQLWDSIKATGSTAQTTIDGKRKQRSLAGGAI